MSDASTILSFVFGLKRDRKDPIDVQVDHNISNQVISQPEGFETFWVIKEDIVVHFLLTLFLCGRSHNIKGRLAKAGLLRLLNLNVLATSPECSL